ncbi:hypothetical protein [Persicobacter psychrovividus]|uniref:Uncharacterized protein n=1 Tax=Persicobacter psychrovividus TaxID=387638 RepID=A0ABM7VJA9_9BACT|nr:hypothetical protein PEPS_33430 [Persicobacter psychrovividus]
MNYLVLIILIYIFCHIPAIVLLILGFKARQDKPSRAMKYFIFAAIYFVIGTGICGSLLS